MVAVPRRRDTEFYASMAAWSWGEGLGGNEAGWIYAVQEDETPLVKIGYSKHYDVQCRVKALSRQFKVPLTLVAAVHIRQWVVKVERYIHWTLRASRIEGEWFYLDINQAILDNLAEQAMLEVSKHAKDKQVKYRHALARLAAQRKREGWTF